MNERRAAISVDADRRRRHEETTPNRRAMVSDRRADANLRFATFRIGSDFFGIDVTRVQEVVLAQPMTAVPLASEEIRGLMNLRGQVVTAFDMRRILGYPDFAEDAEPINLIVTHAEGPISLLVDEQGDYIEVSHSHLQSLPGTLDSRHAERLCGVVELPNYLLLILDVDRAIVGAAGEQSPQERDSAP